MRNVTRVVLSKPVLQIVSETDVETVLTLLAFQNVHIMKVHAGLPSRSSEVLPSTCGPPSLRYGAAVFALRYAPSEDWPSLKAFSCEGPA